MKHETFGNAVPGSIDLIPESCGEVTIGCSEVAGIVQSVINSSERLRAEHGALQGTVAELEADQRKVSEASDEARLLSERAIERLGQGTEMIQTSLGQITELLDLVDTLSEHVTGFAAAMEQVRRCSQDIDQIAETTNILALNATIEAMRAGDAGRTFAVVASEVKGLANNTRKATEEIGRTIDTLGGEAEHVIAKIESGAEASREAKSSVSQIEQTINGVAELVEEVDRQNDQIARSTGTISGHVVSVQDVLESFDAAAIQNESQLETAHTRMNDLELTASDMFDSIVKAGLSPKDSEIVDIARSVAEEIRDLAESGIADGALSMDRLFDQNYQNVPGSNPPRYRTGLSDWADQNWRPVLDQVRADYGDRFRMCAQSDLKGFIPTHMSAYSQEPTGDLTHDTRYCRNGRIIFRALEQKTKAATGEYMMAVYRHEGDGNEHEIVRNVYVPLIINGRRWGEFGIAYSLED